MSTGGFPSYNVPWNPRPFRSSPRAYSHFLSFLGQTRDEIYAALTEKFGQGSAAANPLTPQRIGQLATAAENSRQRFATFFGQGDDFKLPRSLIPRDPGQDATYRFALNVQFCKRGSTETEWRAVILDSDTNLTAGDLQQRASALAYVTYNREGGSPLPAATVERWDVCGFDLIGVTRRT